MLAVNYRCWQREKVQTKYQQIYTDLIASSRFFSMVSNLRCSVSDAKSLFWNNRATSGSLYTGWLNLLATPSRWSINDSLTGSPQVNVAVVNFSNAGTFNINALLFESKNEKKKKNLKKFKKKNYLEMAL